MPFRDLLSFIRKIDPPPLGVSDRDLWIRYRKQQDAAALELIIRRHADRVWTVCQSTTRSHSDAEDAFQTVFLALTRHGDSIRDAGSFAGWLHRVACHACLKVVSRRLDSLTSEPIDCQTEPATEHDERLIVHESIAALPEHERLPILLCDLRRSGRPARLANRQREWPTQSGPPSLEKHSATSWDCRPRHAHGDRGTADACRPID